MKESTKLRLEMADAAADWDGWQLDVFREGDGRLLGTAERPSDLFRILGGNKPAPVAVFRLCWRKP